MMKIKVQLPREYMLEIQRIFFLRRSKNNTNIISKHSPLQSFSQNLQKIAFYCFPTGIKNFSCKHIISTLLEFFKVGRKY